MPDIPVIGQIAISKAGRDKGRAFVVIEIPDESTVIVVDGDMRPVERPKKKNTRHLELTSIVQENIRGKISAGTPTNAEIKEVLAAYERDHFGQEEEGVF